MNNNNKLREAFEKWAITVGYDISIYDYVVNKPYIEPTTQNAWEAWEECYKTYVSENKINKQCVCNNANLD